MNVFVPIFYEIINGLNQFFTLLTTSLNDITGITVPLVGDLTLISLMLGTGLTVFVTYTLISWIIDILP